MNKPLYPTFQTFSAFTPLPGISALLQTPESVFESLSTDYACRAKEFVSAQSRRLSQVTCAKCALLLLFSPYIASIKQTQWKEGNKLRPVQYATMSVQPITAADRLYANWLSAEPEKHDTCSRCRPINDRQVEDEGRVCSEHEWCLRC